MKDDHDITNVLANIYRLILWAMMIMLLAASIILTVTSQPDADTSLHRVVRVLVEGYTVLIALAIFAASIAALRRRNVRIGVSGLIVTTIWLVLRIIAA